MAKLNLFNIFSRSSNKHDKGVTKDEASFDGKYNFANFFTFYKNNFNALVRANLIFALFCFPLILMIIPLSGNFSNYAATPTNMIYPVVEGIAQYGKSAVTDVYTAIYGGYTTVSVWSTVGKAFLYSGLLMLLTFGFANTGLVYVCRSAVRRQHIEPWSDFFYAIKKNLRQALVVGFLDLTICGLLVYDIISYNANRDEFLLQVMFLLIIVIAFVYFMMRFYIYPIMITFDMSIYKIIKNSFIFAILGFKRNICAVLGYAVLFFVTFYSIILTQSVGYIIPFVITISFCLFMSTYCAWPIIDKYMIEPYYKDHPKEETEPDEEPVFKDRG